MTEPFRCAVASLRRDEPLLGTASTVHAFLLVEEPGPWGVDAVRDCRSLGAVSAELLHRAHHARVRVLLIRRHGRSAPVGSRVYAAFAHPRRSWAETAAVSAPEELLDLDLARLGAGRSLGLESHDAPLFCVCTHGRHDACCAEQGRPVAAALAGAYPEQTWEVSHIGGDRFAGNVLVLPDGLYYGRVTPEAAPGLAAGHLEGRLDLGRLRGRCCYSFAVQAAESMLRVRFGVAELYGVVIVGHRRVASVRDASGGAGARSGAARREVSGVVGGGDRLHEVDFEVRGGDGSAAPTRWRVRLRTHPAEPTPLTCRAVRPGAAPTYTLISIDPLGT